MPAVKAKPHTDAVRRKLKGYAARGVFHGFSEKEGRGGKTSFEFRWLMDKLFTIVVDDSQGIITFKDVLPNMAPRSEMYADLKAFVAARHNEALPAHRRIDPKRAEVRCSIRKGAVSLELTVHKNQYAYGAGKLVKLVNELFGHLNMYHLSYLWDEFDVPAE